MRVSTGAAMAAFFLCLGLQGCLYTSHHFNTGRLLAPGEHHWEFGIGQQNIVDYGCSEAAARDAYAALDAEISKLPNQTKAEPFYGEPQGRVEKDPQGKPNCLAERYVRPDSNDYDYARYTKSFPVTTQYSQLISASMGWRLGVREKWGPLTGVDLGWKLEAPTGPATLELDTRLGLPLPAGFSHWSHSLSLGWGIGAWADNSLFSEYALSRALGNYHPFVNARLTYLATQPSDLAVRQTFNRFDTYRRWVGQGMLGCEIILPDILLLPRRILPTVGLAYPAVPFTTESVHVLSTGVDVTLALGLSWGL